MQRGWRETYRDDPRPPVVEIALANRLMIPPEVRLVACLNANGETMTDKATIHAILVGAKALIEDPENWCQGNHFVLTNGESKSYTRLFFGEPKNVKACCADGALILKCGSDQSDAYRAASDVLATATLELFKDSDYSDVNDTFGGHFKILKAFDHAIAMVQS